MRALDSVHIALGQASYEVLIGAGLLQQAEVWTALTDADGVLLVTNTTVAPWYAETLQNTLKDRQVACTLCVLPDGEQYMTIQTWEQIIASLLAMPASRKSVVLALGGGVIGDIAGFAAACYMRGIRVVQVPTTLLAQVDAAVGGKTGINLPAGKNLLGAFHQPIQVVIDIQTLQTLGIREYRAGIAEVIKYGLIMDADFFAWLENNTAAILQQQDTAVQHMVKTSVAHKAAVVSADALEQGQRALLNFGHTFGHALETLTEYAHWLHGEAVAIGMLMACRYGEQAGITNAGTSERLQRLLQALEFDLETPDKLTAKAIVDAMRIDKKASHGEMDLILLYAIGSALISTGHQPEAILKEFPQEYLN